MALKWFSYFCSEVNFLLKVDDDIFINVPSLFRLTETFTNSSKDLKPSNVTFCSINELLTVIRDPKYKWHLSKQEYPDDTFPSYCMGYFVLYSSDVVVGLYNASQQLPYLWIEDLQITGIARLKTNFTLSTNRTLVIKREKTAKILNGTSTDFSFVVAREDLEQSEMKKLWEIVGNQSASLANS
jgi:hypothetical protein